MTDPNAHDLPDVLISRRSGLRGVFERQHFAWSRSTSTHPAYQQAMCRCHRWNWTTSSTTRWSGDLVPPQSSKR